MDDSLVFHLVSEFNSLISSGMARDYSRFFKDKKLHINLPTPMLRKLSSKYFRKVRWLDTDSILKLCDSILLKEPRLSVVSFDWAFRIRNRLSESHFLVFERWMDRFVLDWGMCDDLCTHALGYMVLSFESSRKMVFSWTSSKNMWKRRGSAVSLIYGLRRAKLLSQAFQTADALFGDTEELVLKGCGWMLKEASHIFKEDVFSFLMRNKNSIPRIVLRYASEKFPHNLRYEILN